MSPRPKVLQTKRSFVETIIAVAWSFIGLRRRSDFDRDVGALKPLYVIGAALVGVAILIATLITVVHLAVP